jgi:hypothetical protein
MPPAAQPGYGAGPPPGYQAPNFPQGGSQTGWAQGQPPPGVYQQQPQQGPPPGWQPDPNLPPNAQPHHPGETGYGQFTQQGQGFQPGTVPEHTQQAQQAMGQPPQPPFGPNGAPGWQQPPPGYQGQQPPQQGQPPQMPPGMQ